MKSYVRLRKSIFVISFASLSIFAGKPVVTLVPPGLLGNRLYGHCMARIIAHELDYELRVDPMEGFPNTYGLNAPHNLSLPTEQIHDTELVDIISDKSPRNIHLNGNFQFARYYTKYASLIRELWLNMDPPVIPHANPNDIVVHIRTNYPDGTLPFSYYEEALSQASYDRVYICTNEPDHPFLRNFDRYDPIIVSSNSLEEQMFEQELDWGTISDSAMDDFRFICGFNKIINSLSTFSWWASFLSSASEIYAPLGSQKFIDRFGIMEDDRYHYIKTPTDWDGAYCRG